MLKSFKQNMSCSNSAKNILMERITWMNITGHVMQAWSIGQQRKSDCWPKSRYFISSCNSTKRPLRNLKIGVEIHLTISKGKSWQNRDPRSIYLLWRSLKLTSEILFFGYFSQNICLKQLFFGSCCIKMKILDDSCHIFHSVDFQVMEVRNISNSVNKGCWVSFLGILGVLNPISSSDYSICWPQGHGVHGRSRPPRWNIRISVNKGCWVSFLGISGVLNPISSSDYSFVRSWRSWPLWWNIMTWRSTK